MKEKDNELENYVFMIMLAVLFVVGCVFDMPWLSASVIVVPIIYFIWKFIWLGIKSVCVLLSVALATILSFMLHQPKQEIKS